MKIVFAPLGLAAGLLAGALAKKAFELAWGLLDDEEPPSPRQRDVSPVRLAAALVLEGAIFRLAKGLVEHGARRSFAGLTGAWPGEEGPDRE